MSPYNVDFHLGSIAAAEFLPPANGVWGKVIFFHLSAILFTEGEYLGRYPSQAGTPLGWYTPLGRYTPRQVHPRQVHSLAGTPPRRYTTPSRYTTPHPAGTPPRGTPPSAMYPGIRSTSGRYASYWNAFLLDIK